jgi:hypothetical protein
MDRQIAQFGLGARYQRFTAREGRDLPQRSSHMTANEIGCYSSHLAALRHLQASGLPVHILEDDAILAPVTESIIVNMIGGGVLDQYDVILTDIAAPINNPAGMAALRELHESSLSPDTPPSGPRQFGSIKICNLADVPFSCMASYLVAPRALGTLIAHFEAELAQGDAEPIDMVLRRLVANQIVTAGCTMPFLTGIRLSLDNPSCIRLGADGQSLDGPNAGQLALDMLPYELFRNIFFIGADLDQILALLDRYAPAKTSRFDQVFDRLAARLYAPDFKYF